MARRFAGPHSPKPAPEAGPQERPAGPDRTPAYHGARVSPVGARANLLFLPGVLLALLSLGGGALALASGLAGAGMLILGAWLLRDGLKAEAAYAERRSARRPAIPRKLFAALACGTGAALAAWRSEPGLVAPVIFGTAATALHLGAFGLDPMRDKGMEGVDTLQQDRVARVTGEAEKHLAALMQAVRRAGDRTVEARVERFATKVRAMIRTVEEDPRDLTAARRFLGVYLIGARDAAMTFADIQSRRPDTAARADFLQLVEDLETGFDRKIDRLLQDSNIDLTVEIEVLRDRLKREGVHLDTGG